MATPASTPAVLTGRVLRRIASIQGFICIEPNFLLFINAKLTKKFHFKKFFCKNYEIFLK